ncbi:ectoine/hydroxyectoine ABC transporter substrate-binding protein EhuB [Alcaligenaceae bacterium A4P071]|nr:ectoine/hydroxyectoine ABC transporter substrate-binding protein EhuB [Alcaligenaceae bacterium A4P071]
MGVAAFAAGAVALAGCSDRAQDPAAAAQSTLDKVKAAKKIRVGYANEAPYAFMRSDENQVTGEAVEIARVVLKRMGVDQVDGVLTEFGSLIPGLQAGRFDIIAAGMYVTPERCKQALFSEPTYGVGEAFLVQQGNPKQLHSYEDILKNKDARLGVVVGAIEGDYAQKLQIPSDQVIVFPDPVSALSGVQAGRADAYAGTALTIADLMTKTKPKDGLERAEPFTDPVIDGKDVRGYGAFAFRNADQAFRDAFNAELTKLIGTEEHRKIVDPFGFSTAELPTGVTTAKLCAG